MQGALLPGPGDGTKRHKAAPGEGGASGSCQVDQSESLQKYELWKQLSQAYRTGIIMQGVQASAGTDSKAGAANASTADVAASDEAMAAC